MKKIIDRILLWVILILNIMLCFRYKKNVIVGYYTLFVSLFAMYYVKCIMMSEKKVHTKRLIDMCDKVKGQWD